MDLIKTKELIKERIMFCQVVMKGFINYDTSDAPLQYIGEGGDDESLVTEQKEEFLNALDSWMELDKALDRKRKGRYFKTLCKVTIEDTYLFSINQLESLIKEFKTLNIMQEYLVKHYDNEARTKEDWLDTTILYEKLIANFHKSNNELKICLNQVKKFW